MTVYTCRNKLCVSIPTLVPDPSTHFVWDEFAIGIFYHSPLSHCAWCILFNSPPPLPSPTPTPPKKKERKKERKQFAQELLYNFTWVLTTFTKTIMHLVYPSHFALPLSSFSWDEGNTRRNAFIFFGGGAGEGDIYRVHYGLCANGELQQKRFLCILGGGRGG